MRFVARSAVVRVGAGAVALSLLAGGAVVAQAALTKVPSEVQAGDYRLDSAHGKITWSVDTWASRNTMASSSTFRPS